MSNKIKEYDERKERQEALEHRDVLLSISALLKTKEGLHLFKYLFKSLDVTRLPDPSMEDRELFEYLGLLRAGNSIYKLVCEADFSISAEILSKLERERYDDLNEQYNLDNNSDTDY